MDDIANASYDDDDVNDSIFELMDDVGDEEIQMRVLGLVEQQTLKATVAMELRDCLQTISVPSSSSRNMLYVSAHIPHIPSYIR